MSIADKEALMNSSFIIQPFSGMLGDHLIELFTNSDYDKCVVFVAWAKHSALLRLEDAIRTFRKRGGNLVLYVGIDMQGTSYEALLDLLSLTDELFVVHSADSAQTYHPKFYFLSNNKKAETVVGSNNMTIGGLWKNIEFSQVTTYDLGDEGNREALADLKERLDSLVSGQHVTPKRIESVEEVDMLMEYGHVDYEVKMRLKQAKASNGVSKSSDNALPPLQWFDGSVPVKVPSLKNNPMEQGKTKKVEGTRTTSTTASASIENSGDLPLSSIRSSNNYDILWFEARSLTGGSANQIDLSMKAKIERGSASGTLFDLGEASVMLGGVVFFGVDPEDIESEKMITVSYDGHDFVNNRIYYPSGSVRDNGTWRLQLRGTDSQDGTPFTRYIPQFFLKQKVLAFERVTDTRYSLSIFPGEDLQEFIASSDLVARNGTGQGNAKYLGML